MPGLSTDEIERTSRGKARALSCPLAVRTYRTGAKALLCQSRADDDLWLVLAKAVQTMAMAGSRQSRADERTGQEAEATMGVILALRRYRSGS